MASVSDSEFGAGGKIINNRRKKRLTATPYDRPPPPPGRSPNWFSGVIIPSARAIASGAGKMISSVFYSDYSSSEDDGSGSEDDFEDYNAHEVPSDGINELNRGTSLEVIQSGQRSHSRVRKSETKHIIEQLIMHEMFSREECDRLIGIINSRVVECSTMEAGETILTLSPGETVGDENVDLYNRTVMEAKTWLEEKKVGSSPVSDLGYGTCGFNAIVPDKIGSEVGSPVDMAKSYMKVRPPWASSRKQIEEQTPSTMRMQPFSGGTQNSAGNDSLCSLKKRNSLASGSWNIQEELRKVRKKATDDMLHSLTSKIDLLLAPKSGLECLGTDILGVRMSQKKSELNSSAFTTSIDANPSMDTGVRPNPGLSASDSRQACGVNEMLPSRPTTLVTGDNEDSEAILTGDQCTASKPPDSISPNNVQGHHDDLHSSDVNGSVKYGENEFRIMPSSDGYPLSQTSLSAQAGAGENNDDGNHNNKPRQAVEDKCELLSESYIEVPVLTDLNSENSFSMQHGDFSPELPQPAKNLELEEKADVQPQGKKSVKHRRGRGRGK